MGSGHLLQHGLKKQGKTCLLSSGAYLTLTQAIDTTELTAEDK